MHVVVGGKHPGDRRTSGPARRAEHNAHKSGNNHCAAYAGKHDPAAVPPYRRIQIIRRPFPGAISKGPAIMANNKSFARTARRAGQACRSGLQRLSNDPRYSRHLGGAADEAWRKPLMRRDCA